MQLIMQLINDQFTNKIPASVIKFNWDSIISCRFIIMKSHLSNYAYYVIIINETT